MKIALLVGISGAGKDTIKSRLLQTGHYHTIVTNTTRAPRINRGVAEQDGVSYHFTKMNDMVEMLENHDLIEVNQYGENLYGTSIKEFEKARSQDKIAIADIDVNGVTALVHIASTAVRPIFLVPPSYEVWYERWKGRYGEDYVNHLDDLAKRKSTAIDELRHVLQTPYFFYVVNDKLENAVVAVDLIAQTGKQNDAERQEGRAVAETLLIEMEKAGTPIE
jgi:guanylate kinase